MTSIKGDLMKVKIKFLRFPDFFEKSVLREKKGTKEDNN
jgi:hypothetical protein